MKSIIELISMLGEDGNSAVTKVKIKINQLMKLTEGGFTVGESSSRSSDDGALTDLRMTQPLAASDFRTTEIRRRLTLLQNQYNLIKFEEKINEGTHQSTFIITEVAYPEFLNETEISFQFLTQDTHFPDVNSIIIRNGLHDIRCTYIKMQVGDQMTCLVQGLQNLNLPDESYPQEHKDVITYKKNDKGNYSSVMDLIAAQDPKDFNEIKGMLNQFCDLTTNNEFALYFQSSDSEFPIDLRVFLDKDDEKAKNAQLKLSGFVQIGKGIIHELKSFEGSNQIAIIIKAINKKDLQDHFTYKAVTHLEGEPLERALSLFKEHFPNDKHIQDLVIVSGQGSYSRPYPHIRTQKFWSLSKVDPDTIAGLSRLEGAGCIDFDERPENKYSVAKRNNASYIRPGMRHFNPENDNFQFIIVPKDLSKLEKELEFLMTDRSLTMG